MIFSPPALPGEILTITYVCPELPCIMDSIEATFSIEAQHLQVGEHPQIICPRCGGVMSEYSRKTWPSSEERRHRAGAAAADRRRRAQEA